jgi:hypothetical protein
MKCYERRVFPIAIGAFCFLALSGLARAQPAQVQMQITPPETTVCTPQVEMGQCRHRPTELGWLAHDHAGGVCYAYRSHNGPFQVRDSVHIHPTGDREPSQAWRIFLASVRDECGDKIFEPYLRYSDLAWGRHHRQLDDSEHPSERTHPVMPPGAQVCNPFTSIPANRVGTSVQVNTTNPVPVTWFDEDTDSNEDQLPNADVVVVSSVSDTVEPEDGGSILGCVANTSSVTVSVTFNFVGTFDGVTYTQ